METKEISFRYNKSIYYAEMVAKMFDEYSLDSCENEDHSNHAVSRNCDGKCCKILTSI